MMDVSTPGVPRGVRGVRGVVEAGAELGSEEWSRSCDLAWMLWRRGEAGRGEVQASIVGKRKKAGAVGQCSKAGQKRGRRDGRLVQFGLAEESRSWFSSSSAGGVLLLLLAGLCEWPSLRCRPALVGRLDVRQASSRSRAPRAMSDELTIVMLPIRTRSSTEPDA